MIEKNKKIFNDIILITSMILICLICFIIMILFTNSHSEDLTAEIYYQNELIDKITLNNNELSSKTYTFEEDKIIIEYKNNAIRVKEASCPNQVCVNTGWTTNINKPIICMEIGFKIILRDSLSDYDVIIG